MAPFIDDAPRVFACVATLVLLGVIVFPLRIWIRLSNQTFGKDDYCAAVSALPFAILSAVCIVGAFHGVGVHHDSLTEDEHDEAVFWFWMFEIIWCCAVIPVKLSIAFMLGRIAIVKKPYMVVIWTLSVMLVLITVAGFFYIIFRCRPISYAWDRSIDGECQSAHIIAVIFYVTTALNIAFDWICALLPIPLLWNTPLDRKTKLSVFVLLSLGVLASVAACVRQKYTVALTVSHDYTYSYGNLVIWGYAEIGIGFFVSSLSTLRPLFTRRPEHSYVLDSGEEQQELRSTEGANEPNRTAFGQTKALSPMTTTDEDSFGHERRLSIGKAL